MKKTLIAAAALGLSLTAAPAIAGDAKMTRASDGMTIEIKCRNSGCTVRGKADGGRWGKVESGPGGSANYEKMVAKYTELGFK